MSRTLTLTGGALATVVFIVLSSAISHTYAIWLQTRLLGLVAFFALFLTVLLGELRLLAKDKSRVTLFRYHKPLAIFATYIVLLHFISAVADKYQWGKGLRFTQYLGFTFTDQWMILLSLGTLAFYLMLLIGATSATRSIQLLGFRRWKLIHYLSYLTFLIAFVHAVNLGTDIKHGVVALVLKPVVIGAFVLVTGLLLTRVLNSFPVFDDQAEVNLTAALLLLLLVLAGFLAVQTVTQEQSLAEGSARIAVEHARVAAQEDRVTVLADSVRVQETQLEAISGG